MNNASGRCLFLASATAAIALISLTGGAFADKNIQGSGIVGSVTVVGHKTSCKEVTETQCTADGHGGVHDCHEVETTQCTVIDIVHGYPSSPLGGMSAAPLGRPAFGLASMSSGASGIGSGSPAARFAAPMARISAFRPR